MKRDIYQQLLEWKNDSHRKPLLLRGARQVGKTFIINDFGDKEFAQKIVLNFERNPEFKEIFTSYDPVEIIERTILFTNKEVVPGKTLLFLDEIQECPEAIMALRYFYEEMPDLHVIGAGSLLEFAINSEDFRMPVGRVQYMYLHPLSFGEFLDALGQNVLRAHISSIDNLQKTPEAIHKKLTDLVRKYLMIGGMPAVIKEYVENRDIKKCQAIQHSLIETFIDDFAKYARAIKHKYLRKVFYAVPQLIGNKFVYAKVDTDFKSRDLKEAVEMLERAGIVHFVKKTTGGGIPMEASASHNFFKLLFLDIGLVHSLSKLYTETVAQKDLTAIYSGAVTEQFVGQELLAYADAHTNQGLYYWVREARGSNAEVDYLIEKKSRILPIEVKSGTGGHLKSLHMFLEKYKNQDAIKISQNPYNKKKQVTNIPLYAIETFLKNTLD